MGVTGVADAGDPANVYYNPANVLDRTGMYANGSFRRLPELFGTEMWFGAIDIGGGYREADESNFYSFGGNVTLAQFDYGTSIATDTQGQPIGEFHSKENFFSAAVGAGVSFATKYRLSAGLAVKRWWADYAPAHFQPTDALDPAATAYDIGTVFAVDFFTSGWRITPAAGLAYIDGGSDFEVGEAQIDPLPTRVIGGLSLQADGPETEIFDTGVPVVSLTQNVDWTDWSNGGRTTWGLGLEVAAYQIAYLRLGYYSDDQLDWSESTWGLGIGIPAGSFRARFDYARYPQYGSWLSPETGSDMYNVSLMWLFP
jgi:hypothetical protein